MKNVNVCGKNLEKIFEILEIVEKHRKKFLKYFPYAGTLNNFCENIVKLKKTLKPFLKNSEEEVKLF